MDYSPWIPLAHNVVVFGLSAFSFFTAIIIVIFNYLMTKRLNLASIIVVYFTFIIIWSFTSLVNVSYLIIFWRPNIVIYDAKVMFLIGLLPDTLLMMNSIMGFFLCIDRCLIILFPMKYHSRHKLKLAVATAIILIIFYVISLNLSPSFQLIPDSGPTECRYRGCLVGSKTAPFYMRIKIVISCLDVAAGILLSFLIKVKIHDASARRMNFTVFFIVFLSAIAEFGPSFAITYLLPVSLLLG